MMIVGARTHLVVNIVHMKDKSVPKDNENVIILAKFSAY